MPYEMDMLRSEERGIEKGEAHGKMSAIKSLMETMQITAEKAMELLKIPVQDRKKFKTMLGA